MSTRLQKKQRLNTYGLVLTLVIFAAAITKLSSHG